MPHTFTPWSAAVGGLLIGLSAAALLYFNGRIAGISGVMGNALSRPADAEDDNVWRWLFLIGLAAGGLALWLLWPSAFEAEGATSASLPIVAGAGLLVGFGTRLGGGCTSGHGVCGIARFSWRSIAATCTFMATGAATVFVVRHVLSGAP